MINVNGTATISTPKTAKAARTVALDGETVRVLRDHRRLQLQERLAVGGYTEDNDFWSSATSTARQYDQAKSQSVSSGWRSPLDCL